MTLENAPGGGAGCATNRSIRRSHPPIEPIVPWPQELFVIDPVALIPTTERLKRKGGREIMARCPTMGDAEEVAAWPVDRVSRLHPDLVVTSGITEGGGQYMVSLSV